MAHSEELENLTPEEKKFRECIELGDNFMKIQIYYLADQWYERAVKMQPDNKEAKQKWEESKAAHKLENKSIYAVVGTMALITLIALGIWYF